MTEEVSVSKMNVIIWVSVLCGVAYCRPQYNYNPPSISIPSGSYGRPGGGSFINGGSSGSFIGIGGGSSSGFVSGGGGSSGSFIGGGSGIGGGSSGSFVGGGGSSGGFISSGGGFIGSGGGSGIGGGGGFISGGSGGGIISSGGGSFIGGGGGTLVQKHVYVHVAPPEPEEIRPQQSINVGQATKHYKIIFIKAPSYPTPTAQQIALQAQNQEKTLIYVLVKKPDDIADISIPSIAPVQPTKPEVYFIRYKTQSQGGGGVGGGVVGGSTGNIGGGVVSGGNGIISSGGGSISGVGSSGGIITSGGGSGIDIGSSISGGSIGGGSISGGGLSTNYGPPGQSGPY
ncbi:hypothetical protein FQR65_LT03590 [Abscondita terminalis]|nr:hypothetical protein FQR65_LT03590 [Abscondita terminalis]